MSIKLESTTDSKEAVAAAEKAGDEQLPSGVDKSEAPEEKP